MITQKRNKDVISKDNVDVHELYEPQFGNR